MRAGQIGASQVRASQVRASQVRANQVRANQVRASRTIVIPTLVAILCVMHQFRRLRCLILRFPVPVLTLLTPVMQNNRKVPESPCNCRESLSNLRQPTDISRLKACYLPNYVKNSLISGEITGETGSHMTAHTTIQSPQTARFQHDVK